MNDSASKKMKSGLNKAPHRSLLYALGLTREEIDRPFVGVVNAANEIVPGHIHLDTITKSVKSGVSMAGGVPFEIPAIAVCDGIAMNHEGMRFSLPSREFIADSIEIMTRAHAFDALVFIPNCDKTVPGMLMAMMRLNIPSILVSGGPMLPGDLGNGKKGDLITVFEAVGKVGAGKMTEAELERISERACPGCGACAGMFTANSMNCLAETIGVALPGNGTIPAVSSARVRLAKKAGMQVMNLLENNIRPLDIVTPDAVANAILRKNAKAVAAQAAAMVKRLGMKGGEVALLGGLAENETVYRILLREAVAEAMPDFSCAAPKQSAAMGALIMAAEQL